MTQAFPSSCTLDALTKEAVAGRMKMLLIARSWRFESSLGHHLSRTFADGMLQVGCEDPFETQGKPPSSKGISS